MPFVVISPTQTDAKSPVDDLLMDTIREDLDYLLSAIASSNALPFDFIYPGNIMDLPTSQFATTRRDNTNTAILHSPGVAHRINGIRIAQTQILTRSKLYLEVPARSGSLVCDVRKYKPQNTPILGVLPIYIGEAAIAPVTLSSLSIQSISLATPVINTQSISRWKAPLNVQSIRFTWGPDAASYRIVELDAMPDSGWVMGDPITLSGTTSDDGAYTIKEIGRGGGMNIVIAGAPVGSDQTTPAGTLALEKWSYNFSNPVDPEFAVGEYFRAQSHTSSANNPSVGFGNSQIFATNQGGNNIIIRNSVGTAQASPAGTCTVGRSNVNLSAPADPDEFAVGETCDLFATSTTATGCVISAINVGGDNIQLARYGIAIQASPGGTIDSARIICSNTTDAAGIVAPGDYIYFHFSVGIEGAFPVTEVNALAGTNLVVYMGPESQTLIGAGASDLYATKYKIIFDSDQSAIYSTASRIEVIETLAVPAGSYPSRRSCDGLYDVVDVNLGGGANYNVIVDVKDMLGNFQGFYQTGPGGRIMMESKSVYSVRPRIDFTPAISSISTGQYMNLTDNGTFNSEATLDDGDLIGFCVDELPTAVSFDNPTGLVLQLG